MATELQDALDYFAGKRKDQADRPGDHRMSRFRRWWVNADYDRDHMRRFYETHPDWSDLPPEVVANTWMFQMFAVGEAGRSVWSELKKALGITDPGDTG